MTAMATVSKEVSSTVPTARNIQQQPPSYVAKKLQKPQHVTNFSTKTSIRWKTLQASNYFLLQTNPSKSTQFRIITTNFPIYKVAFENDLTDLQEIWLFLHEVVIEEMVNQDIKPSSRKISNFIKEHYFREAEPVVRSSSTGSLYDDTQPIEAKGFLTENPAFKMKPLESTASEDVSEFSISDSEESISGNKDNTPFSDPEDPTITVPNSEIHGWFESLMDLYITFIDNSTAGKPENDNAFITIIRFAGLLVMPKSDNNRKTLAYIRETNLVKKRRLVLSMLSIYLFILRICSFDLFVVVFLASNAGILYFLKNSRRINMQLAKKGVKQRLGWTKQYLGGFLKKNSGTTVAGLADTTDDFYDNKQQPSVKRRFFGKKKSVEDFEKDPHQKPSSSTSKPIPPVTSAKNEVLKSLKESSNSSLPDSASSNIISTPPSTVKSTIKNKVHNLVRRRSISTSLPNSTPAPPSDSNSIYSNSTI